MADRKAAAKKAARTRKLRSAGKKAARTRRLRAAGRKAALTKRRRAAGSESGSNAEGETGAECVRTSGSSDRSRGAAEAGKL